MSRDSAGAFSDNYDDFFNEAPKEPSKQASNSKPYVLPDNSQSDISGYGAKNLKSIDIDEPLAG